MDTLASYSRRLVLCSAALFAAVPLLTACGSTTGGTSAATTASAQPSSAVTATNTTLVSSRAGSISGATTSSAASTSSARNSTAVPAAASAGGAPAAHLTYLSPDDQGGARHNMEGALFADFTKEHPEISVELLSGGSSWDDMQQKLKTSIAAGAPVNVYQNGWGAWSDVQSSLLSFTALLARDKLDPRQIFIPSTVDTYTLDGKLWGLPLVGISQDAVAYNQDLFDAAGLAHPPVDPNDPSWTMDAFLDHAQKLTKPDKLEFGFGGTIAGNDDGGQTRGTFFGVGPWDDATRTVQTEQPGFVQGLQFFKDLRDRYKVQPDATQKKSIGATGDVFTSGKIGMQVIYGYVPKLTFRWGIVALPHNGPQNVSGRQHAQALQAIQTPLAEQTWTLMRWLMTPTTAARFPLTARYAVSPVQGASDLAMKTYQEQVGVDPQAFLLMSQHSHEPAWGMRYYPGWNTVLKWLLANFPAFDTGKQSASDYGRAAAAFITANLMKS